MRYVLQTTKFSSKRFNNAPKGHLVDKHRIRDQYLCQVLTFMSCTSLQGQSGRGDRENRIAQAKVASRRGGNPQPTWWSSPWYWALGWRINGGGGGGEGGGGLQGALSSPLDT